MRLRGRLATSRSEVSHPAHGLGPVAGPSYRTTIQQCTTPDLVFQVQVALNLGHFAVTVVLCVKFCKGGHGWLESCGLAELNFLVLFEIVHIEVAVGFEPVLVGLDG